MAEDIDSRKSTLGFLMTFAGGAISWKSRLQNYIALSTIEAEYIIVVEGCTKMLWMNRLLHELGLKQERYILLRDNQSVIHLNKNSTFQSRSKHNDVRYH